MHAVVTRSTLHDFEQVTTYLREQGVPRVRQAPGFVGAQWVRLGENSGTAMLTFETEDAARAMLEQLRASPPLGLTIDSSEIGEVVERI